MSREVDASDLSSLSEEDLKYLHDRNQITTAQFAEAMDMTESDLKSALADATVGGGLALEDRANTGHANTAGLTEQEYEQRLKANNGLTDEDEGDEEEEEESYEDMTNDQLRAELASRNLSTSGNKQEMVARLEEDDASEEEEEEEEEQ